MMQAVGGDNGIQQPSNFVITS